MNSRETVGPRDFSYVEKKGSYAVQNGRDGSGVVQKEKDGGVKFGGRPVCRCWSNVCWDGAGTSR